MPFNIIASFSMPALGLCESIRPGLIGTPANAFSNIGYLLVAIYFWRRERKLAGILLAVAILSFISHAQNTLGTLFLDMGGTFLIVGYCLGRRLTPHHVIITTLATGSMTAVACAFMYSCDLRFALLVPIAVLLVIGLEWKHSTRWFWMALAGMGLAFAFSSLDFTAFCDPQSYLQGHALWHLTTALAMIPLERHFANDEIRPAA